MVAGFTLTTNGEFSIGGLSPGPKVVRVEPLDDADTDSFFDQSRTIDVNFRVLLVRPARRRSSRWRLRVGRIVRGEQVTRVTTSCGGPAACWCLRAPAPPHRAPMPAGRVEVGAGIEWLGQFELRDQRRHGDDAGRWIVARSSRRRRRLKAPPGFRDTSASRSSGRLEAQVIGQSRSRRSARRSVTTSKRAAR